MDHELTFEVDETSARSVRAHVLDSLPSLPPRRRTEIELVVAELVGHVIESGAKHATVTIATDPRSAVVDVVADRISTGSPVEALRARLLDTLAESWWVDGPVAGARVALRPVSPGSLKSLNEKELFELVGENTDARDALFEKYAYLASRIGRRFDGKGLPSEDVQQVAHFALLKAMGRFDLSLGTAFAPYAAASISGELKRFLRDRGWSVRVSRGLQERALLINSVIAQLSQTLGRNPDATDIASATQMEESQVREALDAGLAYRSDSLDAPNLGPSGRSVIEELGGSDEGIAGAADWADLERAVAELDDRGLQVLFLRFFEDLTQSEIAAEVGISQMHVSRLIKSSLETLRESLTEN